MKDGRRFLITLIRHGEPHIGRGWCSATDFSEWLHTEGDRGIVQSSVATKELPPDCLVYCSNLRRAIESASRLTDFKAVCVDSIFREPGLGPLTAPHWIRLPTSAWTVVARIAWFIRVSDGPESVELARRRAKEAAKRLDADALQHGHVAVVGHALFNTLIACELRLLGWKGPKRPGRQFWDQTTYVYEGPGATRLRAFRNPRLPGSPPA